MSAVPTLREELDRKVFGTLEYLINGEAKGRLTAEQASFGLDVLFMAVSGLVDNDFINIITEAQSNKSAPSVKLTFRDPNADETTTFVWVVGSDKITTIKRQRGFATGGGSKTFDSAADAVATLRKIGPNLKKKGWTEQ